MQCSSRTHHGRAMRSTLRAGRLPRRGRRSAGPIERARAARDDHRGRAQRPSRCSDGGTRSSVRVATQARASTEAPQHSRCRTSSHPPPPSRSDRPDAKCPERKESGKPGGFPGAQCRPRADAPLPASVSAFYRLRMEALGERDVHRALDVVATAAATARRAAFGIETVDAILEAIPADAAAYVEWRFGDRTSCRRAIPEEPVRRSRDAAVGIRARAKALADRSAQPAQYFELGRGPGPDFDERDRSVLSLLRPHLARLRSRCERRPHLPALTERELDVLALVAQGLTNRQISRRLFISPATVRTHLEHIYDKLGVGSRAGAVSAAFRIAS